VPTVNTRGRWRLLAGVLVVAAASPLLAGAIGGTGRAEAQCLAYFGSRNDGTCLDVAPGTAQSQGGAMSGGVPPVANGPVQNVTGGVPPVANGPVQNVSGGVPPVAIGPSQNGGAGISTGPLFPGTTINQPLTP